MVSGRYSLCKVKFHQRVLSTSSEMISSGEYSLANVATAPGGFRIQSSLPSPDPMNMKETVTQN